MATHITNMRHDMAMHGISCQYGMMHRVYKSCLVCTAGKRLYDVIHYVHTLQLESIQGSDLCRNLDSRIMTHARVGGVLLGRYGHCHGAAMACLRHSLCAKLQSHGTGMAWPWQHTSRMWDMIWRCMAYDAYMV